MDNAQKLCLCGCGKFCKKGRSYIIGHNARGKNNPNYKHGKTSNNKCEVCDNKISFGSKRCNACAGETRGRKGIKRSKRTRKILSELAKRRTGEKSSNFKGGLPRCIDCGKELSRRGYVRCLKCNSKADWHKKMGGDKCNLYGKFPKWHKVIYKNNKMKSFWEFAFAKWCHLSGIKWQYESKTFNLGKGSYTPDFYLPEFDCYIEIKGWKTDIFKNKLKLFKKIYKNINYHILEFKQLQNMGIIYRNN